MRIRNITVTKELASQMDNLLRKATPENMRVFAPVSNDEELNEYKAIGEILEEAGYAKRIGGNFFNITPSGIFFVKHGGFSLMYKQQAKSARREKWLILWGVISTLINVVLGILQFLDL